MIWRELFGKVAVLASTRTGDKMKSFLHGLLLTAALILVYAVVQAVDDHATRQEFRR